MPTRRWTASVLAVHVAVAMLVSLAPGAVARADTHDVFAGDDLQDAIDGAEPGGVIRIHAGVYEVDEGSIVVDKRLTLRPFGNHAVVLVGSIDITADEIEIRNLVIEAPGDGLWAISIDPDATDVVLRGNRILAGVEEQYAIIADGDGAEIRDNVLEGFFFGMELAGDGAIVAGNTLEGSTDEGDEGIRIFGSGNSIRANTLTGWDVGIAFFDGDDNVIEGNDIADNGFGIRIYEDATVGGNRANNNRIEGNGFGVYNDAEQDFDAALNWWGCETGPELFVDNEGSGGAGDRVSAHVAFEDWLTTWDDDEDVDEDEEKEKTVQVPVVEEDAAKAKGRTRVADGPVPGDMTVSINPGVMNLASGGRWVMVMVKVPQGTAFTGHEVAILWYGNDDYVTAETVHALGHGGLQLRFPWAYVVEMLEGADGIVDLVVILDDDDQLYSGTDTVMVITPASGRVGPPTTPPGLARKNP